MLVTVVGPMIIATVMAMSAMYIEGLHQSRQLLTTIVRGQLNAAAGTIDQHRITVLKRVSFAAKLPELTQLLGHDVSRDELQRGLAVVADKLNLGTLVLMDRNGAIVGSSHPVPVHWRMDNAWVVREGWSTPAAAIESALPGMAAAGSPSAAGQVNADTNPPARTVANPSEPGA